MTATCATCRFWEQGSCHRFPPKSSAFIMGFGMKANWAETGPNDWCGEHQPKPPNPAEVSNAAPFP